MARPARLVTREELLQQGWRGAYVSGSVVRACIRDIRAALGDNAVSPQYLETVGQQGYRFLGKLDDSALVRLEAGPVVGRQAEVEQLQKYYGRAATSARQLVIVRGEVGIGKTTVVDLFLASLMRQRSTIGTVRGQCVEHYGAGEPYLPVLEALGHLGQAPGGSASWRCCGAMRPCGWHSSRPWCPRRSESTYSGGCGG